MNPFVIKMIELALTLFAPFLKKLVDLAYDKIEAWARKEEAVGVKPTGDAKMAKAMAMVQEARPNMSAVIIKALLEVTHARKVGKTAGAKG